MKRAFVFIKPEAQRYGLGWPESSTVLSGSFSLSHSDLLGTLLVIIMLIPS